MPEYRAHLDASVTFINGGSLSVEGFRLDLPGADADEATIERLLVQHLGLTLVGSVQLSNLSIVAEAHRGSRDVPRAAERERRVVDLSHVIRAGLVTYPGLPEPTITPFLTREASKANYAPGTEFAMDVMTLIGNTGTYLDSPWHRYGDGADLAGLDLASLVDLRAEVFHVRDSGERGVPASVFFERDVRGAAVLIDTGWSRLFGTPEYAVDAPFLAPDAVDYLIGEGAILVGIDSLNIDDTRDTKERPAHTRLLAAGIHVVEHLTRLDELPPSGARFTAAPPAIEEFGTFPVRAFAIVQ